MPVAADLRLVPDISGAGGTVALARGTTSLGCNTAATCAPVADRIVDLVGYVTANFFEGARVPFTAKASADGTAVTLDPTPRLQGSDQCTVRVDGTRVSDGDAVDPPDSGPSASSTFTTQSIAGLRIHEIQGRRHLPPYRDLLVAGVPGVVTAIRRTGTRGFHVQDPRPDADPRTSEGVFVFLGSRAIPDDLHVGDAVQVSGRVQELRGGCTPTCAAPDYAATPIGFGSEAYDGPTVPEIVSPSITVGEAVPRSSRRSSAPAAVCRPPRSSTTTRPTRWPTTRRS